MNKTIAPIIIVIVLGIAAGMTGYFYIFIFDRISLGPGFSYGVILIVVLVISALVVVLIQRIKEIKKEEQDDLSQY